MKQKMKKICDVLMDILMYVFLAVCLITVFLTISSKKDADGASEIFGYQMRVVTSDSMAASEYTDVSGYEIKDIPVRSMVFIKVMPEDPQEVNDWYRSLKVGDVLTFRYVYTTQVTVTHRITSITEKETGGFVIELTGDNKNSETGQLIQTIDTSIPNNTNYVIGKVVGQAYLFGVILSFLMQPVGTVLIIIVPCFIIMLLELTKIIKTLTKDRREREQAEKDAKESELEDLRRRLAQLENEQNRTAKVLQEEETADRGEDKEA